MLRDDYLYHDEIKKEMDRSTSAEHGGVYFYHLARCFGFNWRF